MKNLLHVPLSLSSLHVAWGVQGRAVIVFDVLLYAYHVLKVLSIS